MLNEFGLLVEGCNVCIIRIYAAGVSGSFWAIKILGRKTFVVWMDVW
jgi:hypothetical protein